MSDQTRSFSFDAAREYWRFAPSGLGKVDSSALLRLGEAEFFAGWKRHFESRLLHYWEDRHFVAHFSQMFAGKRILSFGSGIGHNEIQFLLAGARVTCADIVQPNLEIIRRVSRILGLGGDSYLLLGDSAETDFGGPFDHIFARGSLMHMPEAFQAKTLARFAHALGRGGQVILNLYTWKFVEDTVGVNDQVAFGRASDPSVGETHNPWSDWHDDEKLQRLAGRQLPIVQRQLWNNGCYVWFALAHRADLPGGGEPTHFIDLEPRERAHSESVLTLRPGEFAAGDATLKPAAGGIDIETGSNQYGYAALSREIHSRELGTGIDKLTLEIDLARGGISVGLLDVEKDSMIYARAANWNGPHAHHFHFPGLAMPTRLRVVVSNHLPASAGRSRFVLRGMRLERDRWPDRPELRLQSQA